MTGHTPKPPNQLCAQFRLIPSPDADAAMKTKESFIWVYMCSALWRMVNLITDHDAKEEESAAFWRAPPGSTRRSLKLSAVQPGYHNLDAGKTANTYDPSCFACFSHFPLHSKTTDPLKSAGCPTFQERTTCWYLGSGFFFLFTSPRRTDARSVLIMINWFSQFTLENHRIVFILSIEVHIALLNY